MYRPALNYSRECYGSLARQRAAEWAG